MAIRFKIVQRKNPRDLEAPPKYYGSVVTTGKAKTSDLAKEVAENTTLNAAELELALRLLSQVSRRRLAEGQSVDVLDLCTLTPTVSTEGAETEADFNMSSHLRKVTVRIRPKKELLEAVRSASLEKVK